MYYTIRELSDHADELWVLRSLGEEVLTRGKGGGTAWTNEHLEDYRACWQNPLSDGGFDSALCNDGLSRWANYYIEGLRTPNPNPNPNPNPSPNPNQVGELLHRGAAHA